MASARQIAARKRFAKKAKKCGHVKGKQAKRECFRRA